MARLDDRGVLEPVLPRSWEEQEQQTAPLIAKRGSAPSSRSDD